MPEEGELELLRQLRKGEPSAFHRLVDSYAPRLFMLAYRLMRSREDAEDVVQETLSGVWKSVGNFRGESSLWTWMAKILVRQVARHRRSTGSIRLHRLERSEDGQEHSATPVVGSAVAGVDAKIDLAAAMSKLTEEHRQIVVLRESQRMSYEQISQVMQVPLGTVESRLFRARAELRRLLAEWKA